MDSSGYLTVASILAGFGVTVLMFRIQRELHVRERHPDWPSWLAWADYLVLAAIFLSLLFVVLPLVAVQQASRYMLTIASAACAAAAILLAAYPIAILDHYRLGIGSLRTDARKKGEPIERIVVITAFILATATFLAIVFWRSQK